jgi:hypothetical protein
MCGTNWRDVERQVRGRTDAQCRERWVNILDPNLLPRKIWSAEVSSLFSSVYSAYTDEGLGRMMLHS